MARALITLRQQADRDRAVRWIASAPFGTRLEFKQTKRSIPQNDFMWSMLTDIARELPWHGMKLTPDDWKLIFLDALKRELRVVPNLDGTGFVNLGRRSSDLSKDEMGDLIELIRAFGANHGITFIDQRNESAAAARKSPASPHVAVDGGGAVSGGNHAQENADGPPCPERKTA